MFNIVQVSQSYLTTGSTEFTFDCLIFKPICVPISHQHALLMERYNKLYFHLIEHKIGGRY